MPRIAVTDYSKAWLALLLLTIVSVWFGLEADQSQAGNHSLVALILGFFKVAIVGSIFMGLARAPLALKVMFYGWCLVLTIVLSSIYFLG